MVSSFVAVQARATKQDRIVHMKGPRPTAPAPGAPAVTITPQWAGAPSSCTAVHVRSNCTCLSTESATTLFCCRHQHCGGGRGGHHLGFGTAWLPLHTHPVAAPVQGGGGGGLH